MSTIRGWQFFAAFLTPLVLAPGLSAGTIVGALSVAHPDHAVVYVEKAPGTLVSQFRSCTLARST